MDARVGVGTPRRTHARTHARTHTNARRAMPPKVEIKKDKLTDAEKKKVKQANKVRRRATRFARGD